jgi:hypothetical protein
MYSLGMNVLVLVLAGVFGGLQWKKRTKGDVAGS